MVNVQQRQVVGFATTGRLGTWGYACTLHTSLKTGMYTYTDG